jgi:hypothetical protein
MRKFQKLLVGAMMLSVSIFSSQVHAEEAQAVPGKEGLVAHYTFDTGKGDVLPDASGNGNDGKIHGATWVASPHGHALRFDGSKDYVALGNAGNLKVGGDFTLTAWVNATDVSGRNRLILGDTAGLSVNRNYSLCGIRGHTLAMDYKEQRIEKCS